MNTAATEAFQHTQLQHIDTTIPSAGQELIGDRAQIDQKYTSSKKLF